jgi:excisionase family DNA binding protein
MDTNKWITTNEACKISGYHPDHLRVLIRSGKIDAQKFGPVWQVSQESLISFLEQARKKGKKRGRKKTK